MEFGYSTSFRAAPITTRSNLLLQNNRFWNNVFRCLLIFYLYTIICDKRASIQTYCENLKRRNFFTESIVYVWNSLPANVDFLSLPRFKQCIAQLIFAVSEVWCLITTVHYFWLFYLFCVFWYHVCRCVCVLLFIFWCSFFIHACR